MKRLDVVLTKELLVSRLKPVAAEPVNAEE
jgi:hypothetical protein